MRFVLPSGNWVVTGPRSVRPGFLAEPPPAGTTRGTVQHYVHYTAVRPAVAEHMPPGTIWVDVSASDESYFESLGLIWSEGKTWANFEHDVELAGRSDVIDAFENCPEPWCAFGYDSICHPECMEAWANQLGCVRFRAEVMQAVPDAVSSIPPGPLRDWHNVCDGLGNNLRAKGYTHHWHFPPIRHNHWAGLE